jgi:hypothetical protein
MDDLTVSPWTGEPVDSAQEWGHCTVIDAETDPEGE